MVDVESQESKVSTSNSNVQAKYDELLDAFDKFHEETNKLIISTKISKWIIKG